MSPLPNAPWCEVSIDFKHISQNEYLLVITDDYSRYPVRSTSSKHVIPVMDRVFTMFGVPEVVKSDNGPPFQGDEFRKFAEFMGFKPSQTYYEKTSLQYYNDIICYYS